MDFSPAGSVTGGCTEVNVMAGAESSQEGEDMSVRGQAKADSDAGADRVDTIYHVVLLFVRHLVIKRQN